MIHKLIKERKNILYMLKGAIVENPMYSGERNLKRLNEVEILCDMIVYLNLKILFGTPYNAQIGGNLSELGNFIVVHNGEEGFQIDLSPHLWRNKQALKASREHVIIIEPILEGVYKRWLETREENHE